MNQKLFFFNHLLFLLPFLVTFISLVGLNNDNLSVAIPPLSSNVQPQPKPKELPLPPNERVGFVIVGLGKLSVEQILPAFRNCKFAKVSALMTGDSEKGKKIAKSYGLNESAVYTYNEWDKLKNDSNIHAVYIVTPNGLHKDMVLKAAAIKKHVLCEKPMANSSQDCQLMIDACDKANVKLMIAYRCQFEHHHKAVFEMVKKRELGALKFIEAFNGQDQDKEDQWRHHKDLAGGGALPDVGIYCLNFARFMTQENPSEVSAWAWSPKDDPRFKEIEANVSWQMRFPSGIVALLGTSYNSFESRTARLHFEKGIIELNPAFAYEGNRLMVTLKDPNRADIKIVEEKILPSENQFTLEIDSMADCILQNKQPKTSGLEGLKDQIIIEAIYKSAEVNHPVSLKQK